MFKPWKRLPLTIPTKVGHRWIITKTFEMPNGDIADFQTFDKEGQNYVSTIALTEDNKVIVARQFRPGPEKIFEETPGGFVDAGEDFGTAAARELQEETGYKCGGIEPLGSIHKDSYNNATWHFFFATGCTKVTDQQELDDTEYVEIDLISIERLIENAMQDRMSDHTIVLLAYERLQALMSK